MEAVRGGKWVMGGMGSYARWFCTGGGHLFFAPVVTPGVRPNLIWPPRTAVLIHAEAMIRIIIHHSSLTGVASNVMGGRLDLTL